MSHPVFDCSQRCVREAIWGCDVALGTEYDARSTLADHVVGPTVTGGLLGILPDARPAHLGFDELVRLLAVLSDSVTLRDDVPFAVGDFDAHGLAQRRGDFAFAALAAARFNTLNGPSIKPASAPVQRVSPLGFTHTVSRSEIMAACHAMAPALMCSRSPRPQTPRRQVRITTIPVLRFIEPKVF